MGRTIIWASVALIIAASTASAAKTEKPVSREKFNKVVKVLVDTVRKQKAMEDQMEVMQEKLRKTQMGGAAPVDLPGKGAEQPSKDDSAVDLSALDANPAAAEPASGSSGYGKGGGAPHINLYFDFYLASQPGSTRAKGAGFSFENIHHFFLVEATAGPDIKFMTEIHTNPRFYELDYQFTKFFQLRLGKIWIPFDDLEPHNQFGGHMNVSRLRPANPTSSETASAPYLPDIWAELGVAGKFNIIEREKFNLEGHLFVVNGFRDGGNDPMRATSASTTLYPSFADQDIGLSDNNRNKAYGGRVHGLIAQTVGLGASFYTGRWSRQDTLPKYLSMLGSDAQVYLGRFTFRFGYVNMSVQLPADASAADYQRPGYYLESSVKIGAKRQWKLVGAMGGLNGDNRIVDLNDRQIYGGKLLYRPNNIEWGIEHFQDVKKVASKDYRSFTAFRVIAMF